MSLPIRNMSTPEMRAFWARAEASAREVDTWPEEKKAGLNIASYRSEPRELFPHQRISIPTMTNLLIEIRRKDNGVGLERENGASHPYLSVMIGDHIISGPAAECFRVINRFWYRSVDGYILRIEVLPHTED